MNWQRLSTLLVCVFISIHSYSQQIINGFKRLGSQEAVPGASHNRLFESSDHFLWLSTESGLFRYDGLQFIPHYSHASDSTTISSNSISAIEEDRFGNLWVGSFGKGVNKLNRKTGKWKRYLNPIHDKNPFFWIFDLFKDKDGQLWLGTSGRGLLRYEEESDDFKQFIPDKNKNTTGEVRFENEVRGIAADMTDPQLLWLAGTDGLYKFNKRTKEFTRFTNIVNGKAEWINNSFHTIHVQEENTIWLGAWGGGVIQFDIASATFTSYPPLPEEYEKDNTAKNIIFDIEYCTDSSLYIATSDGFFEFNTHNKKYWLLNGSRPQEGKVVSEVYHHITHTSDGSTWVCTPENIFQKHPVYSRLANFQTFYQPEREYVYKPSLNAVLFREEENQYWMSCNAGYGIYVFDSNRKYLRSIPIEGFAADRQLRNIAEDKSGNILLRSWDFPYLYYYNKTTDQFLNASSLFADPAFIQTDLLEMKSDKEKNLWFVTKKKLIKWMSGENRLLYFPIKEIPSPDSVAELQRARLAFDHVNDPWIATNKGLYHFNQQKSSWQDIPGSESVSGTLRNSFITALTFDGSGNCWIVPQDEGILVYSPSKKAIIHNYGQYDGPLVQRINHIETDGKGDIWALAVNGLSKYSTRENKWFNYTNDDGLVTDILYEPMFAMKNGEMILSLQNGFTSWNIHSFVVNDQVPLVYFNRFLSDGKELQPVDSSIRLPYSTADLTIEFSAIATIMGYKTLFYYRLLPSQKDWVAASQRSISFASINSGEYNLQIKAVNSDGIESDLRQIRISVAYPLWRKNWFILLTFLVISTLVYFLARWRINKLRLDAQRNVLVSNKIVELEIKALRSQMNPHFIFNCINSIDALIQSSDKYNATVYLNKFARLLRNILDTSKENTVLFSMDVETLKLYIELEEFRHENKFKTKFYIDPELLNSDYKVPPLVVQPFVENAILHGLKNKEGNEGLLSISIHKENDRIIYEITDNGIGRNAASLIMQNKESHHGMQMSYERIKLFNEEETASVVVNDLYDQQVPSGTKVKVELKIV